MSTVNRPSSVYTITPTTSVTHGHQRPVARQRHVIASIKDPADDVLEQGSQQLFVLHLHDVSATVTVGRRSAGTVCPLKRAHHRYNARRVALVASARNLQDCIDAPQVEDQTILMTFLLRF